MRRVAVVGFAQRQALDFPGSPTCVELLVPIFAECFAQTGWTKDDIGFWCSGSSDYLAGRSFSFVSAVDAIGALPPVVESHVEMDAAWAMYEAWVKIQTGEVDTALVYGFGKSSAATLRRILALQLDPYTMTPLWPDTVSLAALQARAGLEAGRWSQADLAAVVATNLTRAVTNPHAVRAASMTPEEVASLPAYADPLRALECAPVTDGAAALVLAAEDRALECCARPAYITGFAHAIDAHHLGTRDLLRAPSVQIAAKAAGVTPETVEVAEVHAPFAHQELLVRSELGLTDSTTINPSGGALGGNPMFAGGLIRMGEAASRIWSGQADTVVGHATSGPLLQHNLVCLMTSEPTGGRS